MFNIGIFDEKWTIVNTLNEIRKRINEVEIHHPRWNYEKTDYLSPGNYKSLERGVIQAGERWDENYTYFFDTVFRVPDCMVGKNLYLQMNIGGEAQVYLDDQPIGSLDTQHRDVKLSDRVDSKDVFRIKVQAAKHWHDFIRSERAWGRPYEPHIFGSAKMVCKNRCVEEFYYLAKLVLEISVYEEEKTIANSVLKILQNVLDDINYHDEYAVFVDSTKTAAKRLLAEIDALAIGYKYGKALFMGHSHLDLAFKWTWKETVRKTERTLSNANSVLRDYPNAVYVQSQVKILETLKTFYPKLFDEIANLVMVGRIEIVGDLYVEFDTNIPSGESLIRQIIYGKKFQREHFGSNSRVCYLPDTFGYSGILPQILRQAGYEYFVTTKLDWNDTNKPPYLFFDWHGIDGTKILSHLLASGYGENSGFKSIKQYNDDPRQKDIVDTRIYQYGFGDGGGGINEDMMRTKAALDKLNCIVEVQDMSLESSMDQISGQLTEVPSVEGELYFEKHRGVYTSQAGTKKYNRAAELALRNAEFFSVLALDKGFSYPQAALECAWKKVLFNQFHDIIAGSCLKEVAKEAVETYQEAITDAGAIISECLDKMIDEGNSLILWNTLGWAREDIVRTTLPSTAYAITDGQEMLEYQIVKETPKGVDVLLSVRNIPAFGYKKLQVLGQAKAETSPSDAEYSSSNVLENQLYRIIFDEAGEMVSLLDKANNREVLKGKGNALIGYLDRPGYFESWDIASDFERKRFPIQDVTEMQVIEKGPIRWTMKISKRFRQSLITQYISIYNRIQRVDIKTEMDFREPQILLKAQFDVNIDSPFATYDISMGNLQRATTLNNSFEAAQFEVNMHKWVDLSEGGYGVSILNDSKYGCDVKGNRMRITLLKTSTFPDPTQDIGYHEFTYSIYPHRGNSIEGDVTQAAYELNIPVIVTMGDTDSPASSWMSVEGDYTVIESIKKAEHSEDIIVRLYEYSGKPNRITLSFNNNVRSAYRCNVLEENEQVLALKDRKLHLSLKPYEICTIKLGLQK